MPFVFLAAALVTFVLAVSGYVMNVVTLLHSTAMTVGFVVRVIGLFVFPLGCIAGWF
jgi:hypothetical protein